VEDFEDRLLAAYAKAKLKEKRLTKAEFLLQLPAYLEHEALQLWRKHREEILKEPQDGEKLKIWNPMAAAIKLYKEHFGVASAAKVLELQTLKKRADETCRMLKSRVERLAEDTGLLNGREQAMAFVKPLPVELRQRVEPILWANSPAGVYTLDAAFQVAEQIELAQAYATEMQGWADQGGSSTRRGVAMQAAAEDDGLCFRCGEAGHQAASCKGQVGRCSECGKPGHKSAVCWKAHPELKPDWVTERGVAKNQGLSAKVDKLAEQVTAQLAQQVAALASGRPVRNARQAEMSAGGEYED
jgi:hypothetical protein